MVDFNELNADIDENNKRVVEEQEKTRQLESGELIGEDNTFQQKDPSEFGLQENIQELFNAGAGAVRDEVSSVLTAPERIFDMFSGEMEEQGANYKPDWDPLGNFNPQTKTKWGNMLRGALGYAAFAIPVGGVAKSIGLAGKAAKGLGLAGKGATTAGRVARVVVPGAAMGAAHDLIHEDSQKHNILGELHRKAGWIETPLTTLDTDSPWVKTWKNVAEGMGIGLVFDVSLHKLGLSDVASDMRRGTGPDDPANKALREANPDDPTEQLRGAAEAKVETKVETNREHIDRKIEERNQSINDQTIEQAKEELKSPDFGEHKNPDLAEDWQGNPNSTADMYELSKQAKRLHTDPNAEGGSLDNVLTQAQAIRMSNAGGLPTKFYEEKTVELLGNTKFQSLLKELRENGFEMDEVFKDSYESAQRIINGRDATDLSPEDYWADVLNDKVMVLGKDQREAWTIENVLVADIVNASLFPKVRDLSRAALEVADAADLRDVGGPLARVRENLILGMYNVKRSRFLISKEFSKLKAQGVPTKSVEESLENLKATTRDQVDMMIDLVKNTDDPDLMKGVLEAFSMSNDIRNFDDFDAFMRRRLTNPSGGSLVKELLGVMINSVLSGPKTPLRDVMGTSTAVFTRPMAQMLGGIVKFIGTGDSFTIRQSLASANAMVQTVPEAMQYFFKRVNQYFSNEIHTTRSRFAEFSKEDEQWKLMGKWAEERGTDGDKAAYRIANLARSANQSNFLTYSTKLMAATGDAFTMILARARAKEKAMIKAMGNKANGASIDVNPKMIREYENNFYDEIFDPVDGSVSDSFLNYSKKEATLTKDIGGFGKAMDDIFSKQPLLKPFYLFARTGINGLELSFKHTPGLNFLVKEFNDIQFAKPDNLEAVMKYGIETPQDLANAKALQTGRLMIGGSVIFMASQHYLNGNLTGNGPSDFQKRKVWEDAGWVPRSIKLGNVWVSYDSLEPFSNILASIADLGDNQRLMGDEYVEKGLLANSMILAKGMVSKTYLQGLQQLTDLFGNDPKKLEKIAASLANNTLPLSSLRNEIGRVITPYQRELQSGFEDSIRNRNLILENLTTDPLPVKYDILTGEPIKNWNPATRMFNAISPIQFNFDQSEGRKMLFKSNFDMRLSTMSAPDGTSLRKSPSVRSKYQQAIGMTGLGAKLDELANDSVMLDSIEQMERDLARGDRRIDPMTYQHNVIIKNLFDDAKRMAWASLNQDPEVYTLMKAERLQEAAKRSRITDPQRSTQFLDQADELLNLVNR
jgi:hypothetical protein